MHWWFICGMGGGSVCVSWLHGDALHGGLWWFCSRGGEEGLSILGMVWSGSGGLGEFVGVVWVPCSQTALREVWEWALCSGEVEVDRLVRLC